MSLTSVHEVLADVQKRIKAPKGRKNKFGNYDYRNAEDIIQAAKKIMPDGCILTMSDEPRLIGDRVYIEATATLRFSGESISVKASAKEAVVQKGMSCPQTTGSASSFSRKYALGGLFSLDGSADEDPDNHDNREEEEQQGEGSPCHPASSAFVKAAHNNDFDACVAIMGPLSIECRDRVMSEAGQGIRNWVADTRAKRRKTKENE